MPTKTIWVIGPEGSGKSTLITFFPLAALRAGWVLRPDGEDSESRIYDWQHRLFQTGQFPPRADGRAARPLTFSHLTGQELKEFYEKDELPRNPKTLEVRELTIPSRDEQAEERAFFDELRSAAQSTDEFAVIFCQDVNKVAESDFSRQVEETFSVLSGTNKNRRICVAITKTDSLAKVDNRGSDLFTTSNNRGSLQVEFKADVVRRKAEMGIPEFRVLNQSKEDEALTLAVGNLLQGERVRQVDLGGVVAALDFCTAVGVATDDAGAYVPNTTCEGERESVFDTFQIWWSGIDNVFLTAHG